MENNKVLSLLDKAIEILGRCWEGYKPVAGVKPYEAGSCEKEMATQSDMGEIEEVISMLDKAINFYDPSQERDASGKWSGSGGGSGGGASDPISESEDKLIRGAGGAHQVVSDRLDDVVGKMNSDDPDIEKAIDYVNTQVDDLGKFTDESSKLYYSRLGSLTTKVKNTAKSLRDSDSYVARKNGDIFDSYADTLGEIGEVLRKNASSEFN